MVLALEDSADAAIKCSGQLKIKNALTTTNLDRTNSHALSMFCPELGYHFAVELTFFDLVTGSSCQM